MITNGYVSSLRAFGRRYDSSIWEVIEWEKEKNDPNSDYNRGRFAEVHNAIETPEGLYRVGNSVVYGKKVKVVLHDDGTATVAASQG